MEKNNNRGYERKAIAMVWAYAMNAHQKDGLKMYVKP